MKKVSYLLLSLPGLCALASTMFASDNSHQSEDSPEDTIACQTDVITAVDSLLGINTDSRQRAQRDLFDYLYSAHSKETAIDEETLTKLVDAFLEKYTFDGRIIDCVKHHFRTPQEWHYLYEDNSWSFPLTDSILSLPGGPKNSLDAIIFIAEEFANLPHMILDLRDAVILDQTSGLQKMLDAVVGIQKYHALCSHLIDKFGTFWLDNEISLILAEKQAASAKMAEACAVAVILDENLTEEAETCSAAVVSHEDTTEGTTEVSEAYTVAVILDENLTEEAETCSAAVVSHEDTTEGTTEVSEAYTVATVATELLYAFMGILGLH